METSPPAHRGGFVVDDQDAAGKHDNVTLEKTELLQERLYWEIELAKRYRRPDDSR